MMDYMEFLSNIAQVIGLVTFSLMCVWVFITIIYKICKEILNFFRTFFHK